MNLRNSRGDPVDPVPFLVVSGLAFTVAYSFGPLYLVALGLSLDAALAVVTAVFAGTVAVAYYRYVRAERPDLRGEVPAAARFRRLVYGMVAAFGVVLLLALPLV